MGEVTKLFVDAGVIAIASFISPYAADRDAVRQRLGHKDFVEVYMQVSHMLFRMSCCCEVALIKAWRDPAVAYVHTHSCLLA